MIPVPVSWLGQADGTHTAAWSVELIPAGGGDPVPVAVSAGSIDRSAGTYPRTTARVTTPSVGLPSLLAPYLLPYGTRLRVSYRVGRDSPRVVADLHVVRSSIARPEGDWELEAVDAAGLIAEDAITARRPATTTGTIGAVVSGLIRRTLPAAAVQVTGPAASMQVPADWRPSTDPWRCIAELTDLAGADIRVDPQAPYTFHIRPMPDLADPVDRISVGVNTTGYALGHERTYNAVAVEYKHPDDLSTVTRTGWWVESRPDSPLRPDVIGHHVTLVKEVVGGTPDQAQADAAAASWARREAGRARIFSVDIVPRPWLEPFDTVAVTFAGGPQDEPHLVTDVTARFDGSPMNIRTRNSRYVSNQEV